MLLYYTPATQPSHNAANAGCFDDETIIDTATTFILILREVRQLVQHTAHHTQLTPLR